MSDLNKVFLVGRLGADPIQRDTRNGIAVVNFPLATTRRLRKGGEDSATEEVTQWHKVVVWGKDAENCTRFLKKGASVLVEGNVRSHRYDGKDGQSRTAFEIHAENVRFLGGGKKATPVLVQPAEANQEQVLAASG